MRQLTKGAAGVALALSLALTLPSGALAAEEVPERGGADLQPVPLPPV